MNRDVELRDKILFGKYEPERYLCGLRHFSARLSGIQELIDNGFLDLKECQNDSPTTEEFLDIVDGVENVCFTGYAISPDRDDYRMTIEGLAARIPDDEYDNVTRMVESLRYADEFIFEHDKTEYYLRAWYD